MLADNPETLTRARRYALFGVASGVFYVVVVVLMPISPTFRSGAALLGVWVIVASLIRHVSLRRHLSSVIVRTIPIRFSGNPGRFRLVQRGDGRRVEVRAGSEVVAEAIATDERDELVVMLDGVEDSELDELGAAIGEAIEMVAVADDDCPVERQVAGPRTWAMPRRAINGGVLRSIGRRSG